jgi:hypothetical protein
MSGYLKRMAASVARPAGAIHPVVAGLFAMEPKPEPGAKPGEVEMLVEGARSVKRPVGSQAQESHPAEAARERRIFARNDAELAGPRRMASETDATKRGADLSSHEPLVPGWKSSAMPERREPTAMEVSSDAHRVRGERDDEAAGSEEQSADRAGKMLVPIETRVEEGAALPREVEYARTPARAEVADGRRETVGQRGAKSGEAQHGGEDIQIHIGRIEVIAVPQSAQRPAPARVQHGETLEAYLKRHDRRSR